MLSSSHYHFVSENELPSSVFPGCMWHKHGFGYLSQVYKDKVDIASLFTHTENYGRSPIVTHFDAFFFDVDSTLIQQETIDEVAKKFDLYQAMHKETLEAMTGKIDFSRSVTDRVKLLEGIDADEFSKITEDLSLNPYVHELISFLKDCGTKVVLISGGFTSTVRYFAELIGADGFFANELEVENNKLTGRLIGQVLDSPRKAYFMEEVCKKFHLDPMKCAFVGDGANDRHALDFSGWAIGYMPKPVLYPHLDLKLGVNGYGFLLDYLKSLKERRA